MIIIFDTETNGMIKDYALPCEVVDNYPRLSQLSYHIYDESFKLVKAVNEFVQPEGWDFPDDQFFRDHADINKNKELGKPVKDLLQAYINDRLACHHVVAHNMGFDSKIIRAEMIRNGFDKIEFTAKKICTMQRSTNYCKIPKPSGKGVKWPKLEELHRHLFGVDFEGAHDSNDDVAATAKCFFELLKRGVITLD
jgi:DNA polymerase-3 subunit epsilon